MDSSAAMKVESNDHLLTEILGHLPPKTLFKFMTVSKRWKNIIVDPFFHKHHHNESKRRRSATTSADRLLALFQSTTKYLFRKYHRPRSEHPMNILAVIPAANPKIRCVRRELGYFINSSGGLVLCGRHPFNYHIMNPVTKKWVSLPLPPPCHHDQQYRGWTIGLMMTTCEDNSYIVIRAAITSDLKKHLSIQTYSSETREWVPSTLVGTKRFAMFGLPEPPVVANGVFHWYTSNWEIAVYDPINNDANKNNGINVQLIEIPYFAGDTVSRVVTRSSKDDTLWMGTIDPDKIQLYTLPKGDGGYMRETTISRNEWELFYDIDILSLGVFVPYRDPIRNQRNKITLDGFIPNSDPFVVVLRQREKVFLYNFGTNITESIQYVGCPYSYELHEYSLCPYLMSDCFASYFF
ncbi:hypothetical protein ACP275_06G191000 [Erythranthe tilingii]